MVHGLSWAQILTDCTHQNQPNNQINKCVGKAIASQYMFELDL